MTKALAYFATGMVNIVNLLNPEIIVIGGGMSKMGDRLFNPIRQAVDERAFKLATEAVRIKPAELGDEVGVVGASVFALQQI